MTLRIEFKTNQIKRLLVFWIKFKMLGELEPVSRVFLDGDGYDDDILGDTPVVKYEFKFLQNTHVPETIDTFLLLDNSLTKQFALKTIVHGLTPYCTYGDNILQIYKHPNIDLHICIAEKYPEPMSGTITEDLKRWLECATKVICITFTSFVFYLNTDNVEELPCCIRALHTDETDEPQKLDSIILGTPNYVRGLSAGILTWRQCMNLSGSLYCCYLDSKNIDSMNTADVTKLLTSLKIPNRPFRTVYQDDNNLFL